MDSVELFYSKTSAVETSLLLSPGVPTKNADSYRVMTGTGPLSGPGGEVHLIPTGQDEQNPRLSLSRSHLNHSPHTTVIWYSTALCSAATLGPVLNRVLIFGMVHKANANNNYQLRHVCLSVRLPAWKILNSTGIICMKNHARNFLNTHKFVKISQKYQTHFQIFSDAENEEVLYRVSEERNILYTIERRKANGLVTSWELPSKTTYRRKYERDEKARKKT
jgi:hypothetical protein